MADLIPLFSKPIYVENLQGINLDISRVEWIENYTNLTSKNRNILHDIADEHTIQVINNTLKDFFYGVLGVKEQTNIFITESWLNKNSPGQFHHRHWHPNSVISAVLCLASEENSGALTFVTSSYDMLEFETNHSNVYNSKSWSYQLKSNDIVLFPSSVEHYVEKNQSSNDRITLSFNTFVEGTINNLSYTTLVI